MEFLERYIHGLDKHPKYKFIKKFITVLNSKENCRNLAKDLNRDYIKHKLISLSNVFFKYLK
jgi:hypothetical protein